MEQEELLLLRSDYKNSKLTVVEFAKLRGEDPKKLRYKLGKALQIERLESGTNKVQFHKVSTNKSRSSFKLMKITTSYGSVIEIPL